MRLHLYKHEAFLVAEVKSHVFIVNVLSLPVFRPDGAATDNPIRGPPPRAQPPSVARGNASNIVKEGVS